MVNDGKEHKPAIFLLVNRHSRVTAYTSVNVPDAQLIREDEQPELYRAMLKEGAAAIACPLTNHIVGLGIQKQTDLRVDENQKKKG